MTDYLEKAKKTVNEGTFDLDKVSEQEANQIVQTGSLLAITFALIKIAELMDAAAQEEQLVALSEHFDGRVKDLKQGLRSVGSWRVVVDQRSDEINARLLNLETLSDRMEEQAADLSARITEIERSMSTLVSKQSERSGALAARQDKMQAELTSRLETLDERIARAENTLVGLLLRVGTIEKQMQVEAERVTEVERWLAAVVITQSEEIQRVEQRITDAWHTQSEYTFARVANGPKVFEPSRFADLMKLPDEIAESDYRRGYRAGFIIALQAAFPDGVPEKLWNFWQDDLLEREKGAGVDASRSEEAPRFKDR